MADVLDVASKIATDIGALVAPFAGQTYTISDSFDAAAMGQQVCPEIKVFPGTTLLDDIMKRAEQGKASIGIEFDEHFSNVDQYINTDNYDPGLSGSVPIPQVAVNVTGYAAQISGGIQAGDVIGVRQGSLGAGYAVTPSDTLISIATQLASAATTAGIVAAATGATVTITGGPQPTFNVGTTWTRITESWRRRKVFYATLWAANVYDRQFIGKQVETIYPPATRLVMPDGSIATVLNFDSVDFDEQQRDMAYVRKTRWLIDFIATQSVSVTQIVATTETVTLQFPGPLPPTTAPTALQL